MTASVADVEGVAVALDYLRRDRGNLEAEAFTDLLFELGLEVSGVPDGAGELADAHLLGGQFKTLDIAFDFGVPVRQLQAEGNRFSMDTVGAADGGSVFELEGAALQHFAQLCEIFAENG